MTPRLKSNLLRVLKFILPVIIIGWLLWRVEPQQWELLRDQPRNYPLLGAAHSGSADSGVRQLHPLVGAGPLPGN